MAGYIFLERKFFEEWEWYSDLPTRVLFLHCIYRANWKDQNFRGEIIKRGSFVTSLSNLALEAGLTVKQVRRALSNLEKTGEIVTRRTNKSTAVTVAQYDLYQCKTEEQGKQKTNKRQTKGNNRIQERNNNTINSIINKGSEIDFLDASIWKDFVEHRKQLKKPMTEKAAEMLINKLRTMQDPNECLKQSIENGWQGVFENKQKGTDNDKSTKYDRAREAIRKSNERLGIS